MSDAIDEIINELAFVPDNINCCFLGFTDNVLTDNLKDALQNLFEKSVDILQLNTNIDVLTRRFYIDGQLAIGLGYIENTNNKILKATIMNPVGLYFDKDVRKWKYLDVVNASGTITKGAVDEYEYDEEEIIRIDSGLYNDKIILSHLHNVLKIVNQLQTLEDLLIPLRYSRSVSRRIFNVDVGKLPYDEAIAEVERIRQQVRQRRFYDTENGTITNSSSVTSMTEDYYFPHRENSKGTQVDVLDETGNLGETGDLDYFKQKLYNALKVPSARLMGDSKTIFDFSSTSIEQSEIKFFAFINRLRQRFSPLLIEIMKRIAILEGVLTEAEFNDYSKYFYIGWEKESNFLERQKIDIMKQRLELYSEFKEYQGDIFSKQFLMKEILKLSDEEISQMRKEILEENSNVEEGEDEFGDSLSGDDDNDFGSDDDIDSDDIGDDLENDDIGGDDFDSDNNDIDQKPQKLSSKAANKALKATMNIKTTDEVTSLEFNKAQKAKKGKING